MMFTGDFGEILKVVLIGAGVLLLLYGLGFIGGGKGGNSSTRSGGNNNNNSGTTS